MDQEFRKKTFRGAKIEDTIMELEKLSALCEDKVKTSQETERQRFYEGMAVAYSTIAIKLKGEFDYIEPEVIDHMYDAMKSTSPGKDQLQHTKVCSFCRRPDEEVGGLAMGPGVSICGECLKFGEEVLKVNQTT
ncbi:ClpX C4-type zinc finger protein [Neobacillus mesonae]|nr:ClpX C4-type zinc finger protein [Neobacillus mesonae]